LSKQFGKRKYYFWKGQHYANNVEANYFIMGGTSPHTPHLISASLLVVFLAKVFLAFFSNIITMKEKPL